jgi:hypothetical protein
MKKSKNAKPEKAGLVSVVVFSIMNAGRVLLLGPDENGAWKFPSEEFDGKLNGSLEDTILRSLRKFLRVAQPDAKCIGSFVAKRGNIVEAVYNFSVEAAEDSVMGPHMWVAPDELEGIELDFRTAALLRARKLVK